MTKDLQQRRPAGTFTTMIGFAFRLFLLLWAGASFAVVDAQEKTSQEELCVSPTNTFTFKVNIYGSELGTYLCGYSSFAMANLLSPQGCEIRKRVDAGMLSS